VASAGKSEKMTRTFGLVDEEIIRKLAPNIVRDYIADIIVEAEPGNVQGHKFAANTHQLCYCKPGIGRIKHLLYYCS
jgi:hypothetical protein